MSKMFVCLNCKKLYKMKDDSKNGRCRSCPNFNLIGIGIADNEWLIADTNDEKMMAETTIAKAGDMIKSEVDKSCDDSVSYTHFNNMNTPICHLKGVRGRRLVLYKNKVEIITDVTAGSIITSNVTDGKKTIFFIDCVGVQFKKSGALIGTCNLKPHLHR